MVECIRSVTILYLDEPMVHLEVNERDVQVHILQPGGRLWFPNERATHVDLERFLHTRHIPNRDDLIERRYLDALGLLAWDPLALLTVTRGVMAADPVSLVAATACFQIVCCSALERSSSALAASRSGSLS